MTDKQEERPAAPYVPWSTLGTFISRLKDHGIPPQINKSVISNFSGAVQNQLLAAMRFLQLIDEAGKPTEVLKALVEQQGSDKWAKALQVHVLSPYSDILSGIDIKKATHEQVASAFRERGGVSGATLDRALRFYLAAAKEATLELSPYLGGRRTRGNGARRRPNETPEMVPFIVQIPGFPPASVTVHKDIALAAWDMIDGYVRKYIELRDGKGKMRDT